MLTAALLGVLLGLGAPLRGQSAGACPPQGDAKKAKIQRLNELRARLEDPSDDDYDDTADISALIEPGDDSERWQSSTAVEITAYVLDVQDGGPTSANCHSMNPADHDTVLYLTPGASVSDNGHRMVAVITPRWRRLMGKNGFDWSTGAIRAKYLLQYVSVRGWLLFDSEAAGAALNTAPLAGASITRATAWEIHPVTGIELNDDSMELQTRLAAPAPELYARSNASSSVP
ncbi:MAG: hypothetical protein ACM3NW_12620 [Syntrophomonadaceae bacterium]